MKDSDKRMELEELKAYLISQQGQLQKELNYRLLCDTELENCIYGKVLWIKSIEVTGLFYCHKEPEPIAKKISKGFHKIWEKLSRFWKYKSNP